MTYKDLPSLLLIEDRESIELRHLLLDSFLCIRNKEQDRKSALTDWIIGARPPPEAFIRRYLRGEIRACPQFPAL